MTERSEYVEFLSTKDVKPAPVGISNVRGLPKALKAFQKDIVIWALSQGRCAIFAGTGLGKTLQERRAAARASIESRVKAAAELVNAAPDDPWLIWCHLNDEADAFKALIGNAVEVRGPDDPEEKAKRLLGFADGSVQILLSKPSIAGWGMNFQRCNRMIFIGLNDSFEMLYQAIPAMLAVWTDRTSQRLSDRGRHRGRSCF